jgi:type II secretory pathway pseudopilin PulG
MSIYLHLFDRGLEFVVLRKTTNTMKIANTRSRRFHAAGMTLIEISLVIALLLGLIAVVFLGIGSYRKGSDKAKCKMQLAAAQKAIRSQANFQNLNIGAVFTDTDAFGPGKALENAPECPSGGAYTWLGVIPTIGEPFGSCDFTDTDGVTDHTLVAATIKDW